MHRTSLSLGIAILITGSLGAQPPTPATRPVRPPERPPAGTPARPLPAPEPDLGGGRENDRLRDRRPMSESGDPQSGTLTLKGCLEETTARTFQLRQAPADEGSVAEPVPLQGPIAQLRPLVDGLIEVRGTYEQGTPATTEAYFAVTRVRRLADDCGAR